MIRASENSTNRVLSVSWPQTIGKSIPYSVAAAGLGAALGWGILTGYELVESALRGHMRLPDDSGGDASVPGVILLTLVAPMPVCVIVGSITSLLLRRVALRGRLSALRATATGGLAGVGAVALLATYLTVHAWLAGLPGEWRSRLVLYIYPGAIALVVGAWYGWRMGSWLIKRGASGAQRAPHPGGVMTHSTKPGRYMEAPEFFHLVKENFRYLLDECEFSVIREEEFPYFDCRETVFQAVDCRIRVGLDRRAVYVHVSSIASPDYWYGLATLLAYLTEGRVRHWDFDIPPDADHYSAVEKQLQGMAEILRPYCAQIRELSRQGTLDQKRAELDDIGKQLVEEWLDRLTSKHK